jgi:hypothetical protein
MWGINEGGSFENLCHNITMQKSPTASGHSRLQVKSKVLHTNSTACLLTNGEGSHTMATRFSANDAREKAKAAQKSLDEEKERAKLDKKSLEKERAIIKRGFAEQRSKIFSAAIDGRTEIETDSIYWYKKLLINGIEIIEEGDIEPLLKHQQKNKPKVKAEILQLFDNFIDEAKNDLKHYYGGLEPFHSFNYDALYEAITSKYSGDEFNGDDIYNDYIPVNLRFKYIEHFQKINKKIKDYRGLTHGSEKYGSDYIEEDKDNDFQDVNEYLYSYEDKDMDILKPSIEGNKIKIRWSSAVENLYMNETLFSGIGLAWLSGEKGQLLVEEIFNRLRSAAEMGKTFIKLNFKLTTEGWSLILGHKKVSCCMPDELTEIIAIENFTIADTTSTAKSYSIQVSW